MAAPERFADKSDSSCTAGAVHTWPFSSVAVMQQFGSDGSNSGRAGMSALGHVWTVPAVQEESDFSAKRSGAAMYTACFRLEDYLGRDAATVAAGPDVIR